MGLKILYFGEFRGKIEIFSTHKSLVGNLQLYAPRLL